LVGFAVFGFRENFERPNFAGFWLHALQAAKVCIGFIAQKTARAIAGTFDVEMI
jgi:hypothetical protein